MTPMTTTATSTHLPRSHPPLRPPPPPPSAMPSLQSFQSLQAPLQAAALLTTTQLATRPSLTLATLPPKKTNSDRGKEFRAKRRQYEDGLESTVDALRHEVDDLSFLHRVRQEKCLQSRNSRHGSLAQLAQQYFAFFQNGFVDAVPTGSKRALGAAPSDDTFATQQVAFLHCVMDRDMRMGELSGVAPLVDQWKRYTSYHASLRIDVVRIDVTGPVESPVVTVTSDLHVRYSRHTFAKLFPHVQHNEALVQRLLGKDVTYKGINQFKFSDDGHIVQYDSDVGFVDALLRAGASIQDIALLMGHAMITDQAVLGEEPVKASSSSNRVTRNALNVEAPVTRCVVEILSEDDDSDNYDNNNSNNDDEETEQPESCEDVEAVTDSDSNDDTGSSNKNNSSDKQLKHAPGMRDDCVQRADDACDMASVEVATVMPQPQPQPLSGRHDLRFLLS